MPRSADPAQPTDALTEVLADVRAAVADLVALVAPGLPAEGRAGIAAAAADGDDRRVAEALLAALVAAGRPVSPLLLGRLAQLCADLRLRLPRLTVARWGVHALDLYPVAVDPASEERLDPGEQELLAGYLEAGCVLRDFRQWEPDPLTGQLWKIPLRLLTDGVHVWAAAAPYLVRRYAIAPESAAFRTVVAERGRRCPQVPAARLAELAAVLRGPVPPEIRRLELELQQAYAAALDSPARAVTATGR